jgi:hypothetical protein
MNRQEIVAMIAGQLQQIGAPIRMGGEADITISNEFLDAAWGSGNKRIVYESSITLDEGGLAVYMWEKTTETGGGISGGFSGGSWSQSGTTLFRKVKSVQYGPGGKVYEIDLDLGAIPKTVKNAAKTAGWKFHTVLRREKAQFSASNPAPAAVAPAVSYAPPTVATPAPAAATGAGSVFCIHCGNRMPAGSKFCSRCGKPSR